MGQTHPPTTEPTAADPSQYGSVTEEESERTGGGAIFAILFVFALLLVGVGAAMWRMMKKKGALPFAAGRSLPNPAYDVNTSDPLSLVTKESEC